MPIRVDIPAKNQLTEEAHANTQDIRSLDKFKSYLENNSTFILP